MPRKKSTGESSKSSKPQGTIALTGTAGFIGSSLLKKLEDNPRYSNIIALDYRKPPFELKKTKFYRMDLTETLADSKILEIFKKENVETVIHTAFPVSPPHDLSWAHELVSVGTMYVLNACAAKKIRKFIMASTTEVYGAHSTNPNFLSEDHPLRGGYKSRFLKDKIEAENQVQKFAKKNPETITTILRPCTILGSHVKNYKTHFLQKSVIVNVLGYDPLLQFVHEDDVIEAFLKVLEKDFRGTFNIVGEGVLPLSKVLKIAGKISLPLPAPLLYPAVQLLWYMDIVPAPSSRLDFLKYLSVADGQKAKDRIGWTPRHSSKEALLSFMGAEHLRQAHLLEALK